MNNFKQIFIFTISLFLFYQSSNSQWQTCGNYTGYVLPFAVKDSVLIAGTYGNGIYYTADGINWTYSTSGMTDLKILSLTLSGNYVFAGSESGGVYRSSDNGVNWTPVNNGLTSFEIHTLGSNAGKVYAGTNTGVYMTTNNGDNWTIVSTPSVGSIIYAVTAYDNKIIATSVYGVFITTNSGTNWSNITGDIVSNIYCLTTYNNTVFAGSSSQGVYKTTNDGLIWIHLNSGLPGGKAIRTIFCENEKIYAAVYNGGGIYYLPSAGSMWYPANEGLTQLTCFTVVSYKNYIYAGTLSGIFRRPKSEFVSVKKNDGQIPGEYRLFQNYPNPFNPKTKIKIDIPNNLSFPKSSAGNPLVKLSVYDILGKEITTLVNEAMKPGSYEVTFDATDLPGGIYFYKLTAGDFSETKKMLLIK
jgi:photosystem II stability/assembly factor-like uncharacterized protein